MATLPSFTDTEVLDALRRVVARNPDYTYYPTNPEGNCVYLEPDNRPSCLIGHVFIELGIPAKVIRPHNEQPVYNLVTGPIPQDSAVCEMSSAARIALETAQEVQDDEGTWKLALRQAEEAYLSVLT